METAGTWRDVTRRAGLRVTWGRDKVSCLKMDVWERGEEEDTVLIGGTFFFAFFFHWVFLAVRRLPLVAVSRGYSPVVM